MSSQPKPSAPGPSPAVAPRRGERLATLGTVVSAILATSCCWGPALLLGLGLLGVSTTGLARAMRVGLEAYRPVFIAITVSFLAMAFYLTYRPRKPAASDASTEDC